jgi:hypothetical protein
MKSLFTVEKEIEEVGREREGLRSAIGHVLGSSDTFSFIVTVLLFVLNIKLNNDPKTAIGLQGQFYSRRKNDPQMSI